MSKFNPKEKITCDCGISVTATNLARHKKSAAHRKHCGDDQGESQKKAELNKITCECGAYVSISNMARHKQTAKHKKSLEKPAVIEAPVDTGEYKKYRVKNGKIFQVIGDNEFEIKEILNQNCTEEEEEILESEEIDENPGEINEIAESETDEEFDRRIREKYKDSPVYSGLSSNSTIFDLF